MFDIEYKGGNGIIITTKKARLVADPDVSVVGLKALSTKDAIVVATEKRFALNDSAALLNIEGPGEYEVSDFSVRGVATRRHIDDSQAAQTSTMYRIEVGDVRIALIGNVDPKLSESQLEDIGVVDLAIIPIGGNGYTLDATSAAHMLRALDAKVVIPVHYADNGLTYEVPQDELAVFVKEFGGEVEQTAKYKLKSASSLPAIQTVIELTRS